jgi:hypothetical protein
LWWSGGHPGTLPTVEDSAVAEYRQKVTDAAQHWPLIAERMAAETSVRRQAMLTEVVAHMVGEYTGNTPMVMTTMIEEPVYHYWGLAPTPAPVGRAEVRERYEAAAATQRDFAVDRVVLDDQHVVTEGALQLALPAASVEAMGVDTSGQSLEPGGRYLVELRVVVLWPFSTDAKIAGEDIYFGSAPVLVRPLAPDEILYAAPT